MWTVAALISADKLEVWWASISGISPEVAILTIFILLFLAGCGLPLPEDIPLTFAGIFLGLPNFQLAFGGFWGAVAVVALACYTSILTGDLVAYTLGKKYGKSIAKVPPFSWAMTEKRMARLDRWFGKFGNATVFFGRMVAGVRFVTFVMAGVARMPMSRFIMFDSLAALITVPAWIVLGYVVGTHFKQIIDWMSTLNRTTWIFAGVTLVLLIVYKLYKRYRGRKAADTPTDQPG
jgi:membrane protein DedA with SNARE-associated domain